MKSQNSSTNERPEARTFFTWGNTLALAAMWISGLVSLFFAFSENQHIGSAALGVWLLAFLMFISMSSSGSVKESDRANESAQ